MVTSIKYLRTYWKFNVKLHAFLGLVIAATTVGMALYALKNVGWAIIINNHFYFIAPVVVLVVMVAIGGMLTRYMLQNSKWNTQSALKIKKVHKVIAYSTILLSIGAVGTGIYQYRINPNHPSEYWFEIIYLSGFVIVSFIVERVARAKNL